MAAAGVIEPFRIQIADAVLADLRERLATIRWPIEPSDAGWRYGANLGYMQDLAIHWRERYDWRHWEREINRLPQYRAQVGELKIHFVMEPGSGPRPLPLLITHGWPGSVFEFYGIIEALAHPERFGGRTEDAFTVVAPSIPGYGFSAAPPAPVSPRDVGQLWHRLMTEVLGLPRFVAQAGDWGSVISSRLALDHPEAVIALHLNMFGARPYTGPGAPQLSDEEKRWVAAMQQRLREEGAYQDIQGTKPQSLAYGLTDSPIGLAAWIIEKFHGWVGAGPDAPPPFPMDHLLTNVMLYWVNGINAANWLYWSVRHGGRVSLDRGQRIEVPTGFAFFPDDLMLTPPASWTERAYNVVDRRDFDRGGHFAAMENGPLLVEEMRRFFGRYRT